MKTKEIELEHIGDIAVVKKCIYNPRLFYFDTDFMFFVDINGNVYMDDDYLNTLYRFIGEVTAIAKIDDTSFVVYSVYTGKKYFIEFDEPGIEFFKKLMYNRYIGFFDKREYFTYMFDVKTGKLIRNDFETLDMTGVEVPIFKDSCCKLHNAMSTYKDEFTLYGHMDLVNNALSDDEILKKYFVDTVTSTPLMNRML